MTFLSPIFFWAFLSLLPLTLIYLLKVRPRRKPVTAYFLWQHIFQQRRPNRLLQRLRDLWSLLLMALAFSAVCLALTNPQTTVDDRKDVLLLIDHSASMNTRHGGQTRLDAAKKAAGEILRAFDGTQRAAVAAVAADIRYMSHLSDNPRALLDAVETIEPTDYAFRPEVLSNRTQLLRRDEANAQSESESADDQPNSVDVEDDVEGEPRDDAPARQADSDTNARAHQDWLEKQRIILITDGCFDRDGLPPGLELFKVGKPAPNMGLIAADLRRIPGGPNRLGLYFQVSSTYKTTVNVDLLVSRGIDAGQLFKVIPLEIEPGVSQPQVFTLEDAESGAWTLQLDRDDALTNDNIAYLAVAPHDPVRVRVASDDRFFFENSVLAFSQGAGLLELVDADTTAPENADIVISKSAAPDAPRTLILQPSGESPWWSSLGELLDGVVPRVAIEEHPLLRHIDVGSMSFVGARHLQTPAGAEVLVASDDGTALIYRATAGEKTAIVVNMDPVLAEFYFSAWFPVLVHAAATHLAARDEIPLATHRPGDTITILGSQPGDVTAVTTPSQETVSISQTRLGPIEQVGFYQLENEGGNWLAASSLLSEQDSTIDNQDVTDSSKPISKGWPAAHLLTVLAVIVLATESLLYHRRKVG